MKRFTTKSSGFTTKRAERRTHVFIRAAEASAGRKTVRGFTTKQVRQERNSDFSFANERWEQVLSSGFTLIEALIAITIVTFAVVGPLFTANRAIVAAQNTRFQLTASYLAQEGIEYVRAMRDDTYLAAYQTGGPNVSRDAWNEFINGLSTGSITQCRTQTCVFDPTRPMGVGTTGSNNSLQTCSGLCAPLYMANNGTSNIYTPRTDLGGTLTPFTRTIRVDDISTDTNDKRIVSTVSWDFHGTLYSVTITDHLTPWQ